MMLSSYRAIVTNMCLELAGHFKLTTPALVCPLRITGTDFFNEYI